MNASNLLHRVTNCGNAEDIGAGPELSYQCSRGWIPDISPVNGSFFQNSPCGHNQTITPQSVFWFIRHTTHPNTAHSCRRQMTSISYDSPDENIVTVLNGTRFTGTTLTSVTELFSHLPPATVYVPLRGACGIFQHTNKDCKTSSLSLLYTWLFNSSFKNLVLLVACILLRLMEQMFLR